MIEFFGKLSDESIAYLLKDLTRASFFAALFAAAFMSIPVILIGTLWESWVLYFLILTGLMFILLACPKTNPQKQTVMNNIFTKITIQNEVIEGYGDGTSEYVRRELAKVKKVIDLGNQYHIVFYFPSNNAFFLCQKDLIAQGTIEEFEKLFEGKIIRKTLKEKIK